MSDKRKRMITSISEFLGKEFSMLQSKHSKSQICDFVDKIMKKPNHGRFQEASCQTDTEVPDDSANQI